MASRNKLPAVTVLWLITILVITVNGCNNYNSYSIIWFLMIIIIC